MSLELAIQNLADAINALAKSATSPVSDDMRRAIIESVDSTPTRGRGRPRKEQPEPVEQSASPAPLAVEPAAVAPVPVVAEVAAASSLTKDAVSKVLMAVVQRIGKAECIAMCEKYGARNLSAIDPANYGGLYTDATAALAAITQ